MVNFATEYVIMKRLLFLLFFCPISMFAQFVESNTSDIRSLRMEVNDVWDAPAVIMLGSDDVVTFSFDEMSHTYSRYTYRIVHCNFDWSQSELLPIDYLSGFNDLAIENVRYSENTIQSYTNYSFSIPNEEQELKVSGNYKVEVYDDESDDETPVAIFGFLIVEHKVRLGVEVSGDTDIDYNRMHQQLDIIVDYSGYNVSSPGSDLKVSVSQNHRRDNAVVCAAPTYITADRIEYVHHKPLIFNAGNEYRRFEITDPYSPGMGVDNVLFTGDNYDVYLYTDSPLKSYSNVRDENGRFYINTNEGLGSEIEADYAFVHFTFDAPYRSGGSYYLLGDFWGNNFFDSNKMVYDYEDGVYRCVQLMKFGVYNYNYVWLPDNKTVAVTEFSEGDFYNTSNEYLVKVYHREFGSRYDKLVGALVVK